MIARELGVAGAYAIDPEPFRDERGTFARLWSPDELERHGLVSRLRHVSLSTNRLAGTIRGLHFQAPPHEETKIVTCVAGVVWDVILDLREGSPTFRRWQAVRLDAGSPLLAYVPAGCAHGFQTLVDGSAVLYHISADYVAAAARGVRFDDPTLAIPWPLPPTIVSPRDRALPALGEP